MKYFLFTFSLYLFSASFSYIISQKNREDIDDLLYETASIKDRLYYMKMRADSTRLLQFIEAIEVRVDSTESYLQDMPLKYSYEMEENIDTTMEISLEPIHEDIFYPSEDNSNDYNTDLNISMKRNPLKDRFNSHLLIQFGVNGLDWQDSRGQEPGIIPGKSWFWEFGMIKDVRLGSQESNVLLEFGVTYLRNRFRLDRSVVLISDSGRDGGFESFENNTSNVRINNSFITIPINLVIGRRKNLSLGVGGYAGYRMSTVQKLFYVENNEDIEMKRSGDYNINDWLYGAQVSLSFKNITLIGKYHLSNFFENKTGNTLYPFMIGTSIKM